MFAEKRFPSDSDIFAYKNIMIVQFVVLENVFPANFFAWTSGRFIYSNRCDTGYSVLYIVCSVQDSPTQQQNWSGNVGLFPTFPPIIA